ncbi:ArnT family glycosyltransferase [Thermoproteota archaeon]
MKIVISLFLVAIIFDFDRIISLFKGIDNKAWTALLLIILSGFALRMWFVPHTHHVYFDEFEHVNIAQNFMSNGKFAVTDKGSAGSFEEYNFHKRPPAYYAFLALAFSVFGDTEQVAFNFSAVIGSLSILIVFLIGYLMFDNKGIALFSAFLFNLIPVHLRFSGSTQSEITSLFLILLTLLAMFTYLRLQKKMSLFLLISTSALAIYARPENGILLLLIPLSILLYKENLSKSKVETVQQITIFLGATAFLLIPYIIHLYLVVFAYPAADYHDTLFTRLSYLKSHLPGNILFWFSNAHPILFTIFAIFGSMRMPKKHKRNALFLLLWFFLFLILYSQYGYGDMLDSYNDDRYSLNLYISIVLLAAFGIREFIYLFKAKKIITMLVIAFISAGIYSPYSLKLNKSLTKDTQKEYQFILESKEILPDDQYILSCNSSAIISSIRKKAMSPYIFVEMKEKPDNAILFIDYWWYKNSPPGLNLVRKKLEEEYTFETIKEKVISNEMRFSFVKLTKKK